MTFSSHLGGEWLVELTLNYTRPHHFINELALCKSVCFFAVVHP